MDFHSDRRPSGSQFAAFALLLTTGCSSFQPYRGPGLDVPGADHADASGTEGVDAPDAEVVFATDAQGDGTRDVGDGGGVFDAATEDAPDGAVDVSAEPGADTATDVVLTPADAGDASFGADVLDAMASRDAPEPDATAGEDRLDASDLGLVVEDRRDVPSGDVAGDAPPDAPSDVARCSAPSIQCGARCLDPRSDIENCSACGRVCPAPARAFASCVAGSCGGTCLLGSGDCNGTMTDGCETSLDSAVEHCGACGARCGSGEVCLMGACHTLGTNLLANPGFEDTADVLSPPTESYSDGVVGWSTYDVTAAAGNECRIITGGAPEGGSFARCQVAASMRPSFELMLLQARLTMTNGRRYRFSFRARALASRVVSIAVTRFDLGWSWMPATLNQSFTVTTAWATYTGSFVACVRTMDPGPCVTGLTDSNTKFNVELPYGPGQIDLDDLRLQEVL